MTREEVIAILKNEKECVNRANKNDYCNRDCYNCELVKTDTEILTALDMAISALSENKGEWIKIKSGDKDFPESIVCSKCKNENSHLDFNEHNEPIGKVFVTSKFCSNCGADMRGDT